MPSTKEQTIYRWKGYGLIYDDYSELYEVYIKTMNCQHCQKEFKDSHDRCMDHDHYTGLFRKIVCQKCNAMDSYIKYPNGYDKSKYDKQYRKDNIQRIKQREKQYYEDNKEYTLEKHNQYHQENKEEINQKRRQPTTCLCGQVITIRNIARHQKSQKHLKNMDKYMENID
jgi:hypothetical protein|tara:strand:- start:72 stop:581 length:510 start_codon:yes stop_codon:yes gene_type:complete